MISAPRLATQFPDLTYVNEEVDQDWYTGEMIPKVANRVIAEGLSVRATEEAVTLYTTGEKPQQERKPAAAQPQYFTDSADHLALTLTHGHGDLGVKAIGKTLSRVVEACCCPAAILHRLC